jgi:hypothetical protein
VPVPASYFLFGAALLSPLTQHVIGIGGPRSPGRPRCRLYRVASNSRHLETSRRDRRVSWAQCTCGGNGSKLSTRPIAY